MSETQAKDHYDWWRRAIAGEKPGGPTLPIHENEPHCGYFRKRIEKGGAFTGVAIYLHGEKLVALEGKDHMVEPERIWTWIADKPVTYEAYLEWSTNGRWPDMAEAVENSLVHGTSNSAGMTEAEKKKAEIDSALEAVKTYAAITDDEKLAQAQSARSRLLELSGDADKIREKEKAPHLEAGRKVDATWQPLVKIAKDGADKIRTVMSAYVTKRDNDAAAARKAEEDRLAAEALKNAPKPKKGEPAPAPAPAPPPAPLAESSTTIRSGYGRAASILVKKVVTITDQDAAYQSLKTHKDLVAMIQALAERAVKAGMADKVQGITVTEEKDVR